MLGSQIYDLYQSYLYCKEAIMSRGENSCKIPLGDVQLVLGSQSAAETQLS